MIVDYLGHSGFLVETEKALLLFDACGTATSVLDTKDREKPLFVFVSHAHADHFDPAIFSLRGKERRSTYILSIDLRGNEEIPPDAEALYADADQIYEVDRLGTVQTLLSTDEGVAYLVKTGGETVYHAGDLHWWNWEGEDSIWLADQERVYKREIGLLAKERIDAAFIVLDDRLEGNYAGGAEWFLSVCRPSYAFPMHYWKDRGIVGKFILRPGANNGYTKILDTTKQTHWEI